MHHHQSECLVTAYERVEFIITYNHNIFFETAMGIRQALLKVDMQELGVTMGTAIMMDGFRVVGDDMEFRNPEACSTTLRIQIVVGISEQSLLLKNYIAFYTEQMYQIFPGDDRMRVLLKEAVSVWCFSRTIADKVSTVFLDEDKSKVLPMLLYTDNSVAVTSKMIMEPGLEKIYDVGFFGIESERRTAAVETLQKGFMMAFGSTLRVGGVLVGANLNILSGAHKHRMVAQSKVALLPVFFTYAHTCFLCSFAQLILNIHRDDNCALEVKYAPYCILKHHHF
jgi:hypothetical protein